MKRRPISVTIIGWLFIAVGGGGFLFHAVELLPGHHSDGATIGVCLLNLITIPSGLFLLRGRNWARWLLLTWTGYHVILSVGHPWGELFVHSILFAVIAGFLFQPRATVFFSDGFIKAR